MTTKQAKITEHTWELLHGAFVTPQKPGAFEDPPTLRELARTFGVPFQEADRREALGNWEEEREANRSREWLKTYGGSATTEAEFLDCWGSDMHLPLRRDGPEGERLARAMAHRVWVKVQASIALWEAIVEQESAREAYDALLERRRGRAA